MKVVNMKLNKYFVCLTLALTSNVVLADEVIEPIMVTIPAGSFDMGTEDRKSTQPVHRVTLKEFSMGKYEVTVNEFRRFVEATNYPVPTECRHELDDWFRMWTKGNWETNRLNTSEYQPVVCINWKAADAYVKWLAEETGKPYRLPSEAEWEYAARAGTKTKYFFGDDDERTQVCKYANTADLYGENILQRNANTSYINWDNGLENCVDYSGVASIVGMYLPNQFGLYDVISNVQEMLADCFVYGYEGAPTDGSAWLDGECKRRSVRGSSWHWNNFPLAVRSSIREEFSGGVDGFRIAMDGPAPTQSNATKRFAKRLKRAQDNEQKRRELVPEIPAPIENLTLSQNKNVVTLKWQDDRKNQGVTFRVYRNKMKGKRFQMLATNLTNTKFIDANASPNEYEYTVVAVQDYLQSNYSTPVATTAYRADVNSKIEAEWASEFTASEISWSEAIERTGFSMKGDKEKPENASLKYEIEAPKAGFYKLEYRVAAPETISGFEVFTNGRKAGTHKITQTGGDSDWQTQQGGRVYLKKGANTLTFKSSDNNWKLNWFNLNKVKS